jgi:ribonuclease D
LINNDKQLAQYLETIEDVKLLGIDTEFRRVDSYFPELCLIQIATDEQLECIDVLFIKSLEPLFEKLYDNHTKWVVHSARQDIEALYYLSKRVPKAIFDTQIAAAFLNFPLQVSYQNLTETLENVLLEKKHTRFDWKKRPLPSDVLQYALDDVKYLIPIYKKLTQELIKHKKLEWSEEESQFLIDKETYRPNLEQIIKKTKGISKIPSKSQENAIRLILWRESVAQKKNKPRKWIMSDDKLISCANGKIKLSASNLEEFNNFLKTNNQEFNSQELLKAHKPLSDKEVSIKNQLKEQISSLSLEYNIPSELICTSKNVLNFIRSKDQIAINKGWRSKIFKI